MEQESQFILNDHILWKPETQMPVHRNNRTRLSCPKQPSHEFFLELDQYFYFIHNILRTIVPEHVQTKEEIDQWKYLREVAEQHKQCGHIGSQLLPCY